MPHSLHASEVADAFVAMGLSLPDAAAISGLDCRLPLSRARKRWRNGSDRPRPRRG